MDPTVGLLLQTSHFSNFGRIWEAAHVIEATSVSIVPCAALSSSSSSSSFRARCASKRPRPAARRRLDAGHFEAKKAGKPEIYIAMFCCSIMHYGKSFHHSESRGFHYFCESDVMWLVTIIHRDTSVPQIWSPVISAMYCTTIRKSTCNLKITQLKRKIIFHPPPFLGW